MEIMIGIIIMKDKKKLFLIVICLMLLLSGCGDLSSKEIVNTPNKEEPQETTVDIQENADRKYKNGLYSIMSEDAKREEERIIKQLELLSKDWVIDEALFGNRLINIPSDNPLGKMFTLDEDNNVVFDNDVYKIINIDIFSSEDLYSIFSYSSADVRRYNDLTVFTLETSSVEKYEQIHIMVDKEIESIYCDIHENELQTGFYKTSLLNEQ